MTRFLISGFPMVDTSKVRYGPEEMRDAIIITALISVFVAYCLVMLTLCLIRRRKHNVFFGDYNVVTVRHNRIVPLPEPKKEGYTFCGWYKNERLTQKWYPTEFVKSDVYLYPKWEKNSDEQTEQTK